MMKCLTTWLLLWVLLPSYMIAQPFAQLATMTAADPATPNDYFGSGAAISGDYAVVGAPYKNIDTVISAGTAYLYHKYAGGVNGWGQVKQFLLADTLDYASFGYAASMDGEWLAISAPYYPQDSGAYSGLVTLYHQNAGGPNNWGQVKQFWAKDQSVDNFAESLLLSGDYLVVGSPFASLNGISSVGAVHLYHRNAGGTDNWGLVQRILPNDTLNSQQYFGEALALEGDKLVIGYTGYRPTSSYHDQFKGAASVHYKDAGGPDNWGQMALLTAYDAERYDVMGKSVAIVGDLVLVGLTRNSANMGKIYTFKKDLGGLDNWGYQGEINGTTSGFGYMVLDGHSLVVADSEALRPTDSVETGALYYYEKDLGGLDNWGLRQVIIPDSASRSRSFPVSLDLDGGYIIASTTTTLGDGFSGSGEAYIFQNVDSIMTTTHEPATLAASISPNPLIADAPLTITQAAGAQAILYNALGQVLQTTEVSNDRFDWHLHTLPRGQYVLRLIAPTGEQYATWLFKH